MRRGHHAPCEGSRDRSGPAGSGSGQAEDNSEQGRFAKHGDLLCLATAFGASVASCADVTVRICSIGRLTPRGGSEISWRLRGFTAGSPPVYGLPNDRDGSALPDGRSTPNSDRP